MHVAVKTAAVSRTDKAREEMREVVEQVFTDAPGGLLLWKDAITRTATLLDLKFEGARSRFNKMRTLDLIVRTQTGEWRAGGER